MTRLPVTGPEPVGAGWHPRRRRGSRVGVALLTAFVVLCMIGAAFLLLGLLTQDTGVVGFLAGTALALVPVVPVFTALTWLDRYEPEPGGLLAFCFGWGATVAALIAVVLNSVTLQVLDAQGGDGLTTTSVVVAPFIEEAVKGSVLLLILRFRRDEFDGVVDGIVLGGVTALGFAFTENILYFGRAFLAGSQTGGQGLFALGITFVLRGVLSPFAHPLFTACTGVGVGLAATSHRRLVRWFAPLVGYLVAVCLHSLWNIAAVAGLRGFVSAYVVVMVPLFAVGVGFALLARRREGRLIRRQLPAYAAAGWLAPAEIPTLASLPARRAARDLARRSGGRGAERAVAEYQHVATELAFLRDRAERRGPGRDFQAAEMELLQRLAMLRRALPAAPTYPLRP